MRKAFKYLIHFKCAIVDKRYKYIFVCPEIYPAWRVIFRWQNDVTHDILYLKDYEALNDGRKPKASNDADDYRERRRRMVISPERHDAFAAGMWTIYSIPVFWLAHHIL